MSFYIKNNIYNTKNHTYNTKKLSACKKIVHIQILSLHEFCVIFFALLHLSYYYATMRNAKNYIRQFVTILSLNKTTDSAEGNAFCFYCYVMDGHVFTKSVSFLFAKKEPSQNS